MKVTVLAKCNPTQLPAAKEIAANVGLSIISYGVAPGSKNLTVGIVGNHNTVTCFLLLMQNTRAMWFAKDKKVTTPAKV